MSYYFIHAHGLCVQITAPILEKQIQSWFCAAIFGFNKAISPSQLVNPGKVAALILPDDLSALNLGSSQNTKATCLPAANSAGSYRRLSMI